MDSYELNLTSSFGNDNYEMRIPELGQFLGGEFRAAEIMLLPVDYYGNVIAKRCKVEKESDLKIIPPSKPVNAETGKAIGKILKQYSVESVQVHYPATFGLLDNRGIWLEQTILYMHEIARESGAKNFTLNHHNVVKDPVGAVECEYREELLETAKSKTKIARTYIAGILDELKSDVEIQLVVENNPIFSPDKDKHFKVNDMIDLIPEDFKRRIGLAGFCFDYPHAWSVVEACKITDDEHHKTKEEKDLIRMKNESNLTNLSLLKKFYYANHYYGKKGYSDNKDLPTEIEEFFENLTKIDEGKIKWVHIGDEATPFSHEGLPPLPQPRKKGVINFHRALKLLKEYARGAPITVEISTPPIFTNEGFEVYKESDRFLREIALSV